MTSDDGKSTSLAWILDGLEAGTSRSYTLSEGSIDGEAGVNLDEGPDAIDITVNGRPFTTFKYAKTQHRPYFFSSLRTRWM